VALYQGRLFAVDYDEDLLALDISVDDKTGNPQVSRIGQAIKVNRYEDALPGRITWQVAAGAQNDSP
jgi:hypothetical protein